MLLSEKESALRLISQFVFHDAPRNASVFDGIQAYIAVYSVCLEILPIVEETRSTRPGARKRECFCIQKESQQAQIESVCFYAPMGMLPLGRDLILLLAEEAIL